MTNFRSSRRPSTVIPIRNRKRLNFAALALVLLITAAALLFALLPFARPNAPLFDFRGDHREKDQLVRLNPIESRGAMPCWSESRCTSGQAIRQLQQQHPPQRFTGFGGPALLPAADIAALLFGHSRNLRFRRDGQKSRYCPEVFANASPIRAGPDAATALRLQIQPEMN